ncbi:hypothetical protein BGZ60DRAFT_450516 [Tricladium varicosporioides]|nr:hypothetical protein BGZ60DRAFT_450516 [Hymenoscyphus varicosporioides]
MEYQIAPPDSDECQISSSKYWWKPIVWMLVWILLGILGGLGHHFGYQSLHRQPQAVFSQTWIHGLGTGAAFLVKSSFTLSILIALQEVLWFSFRQRAMKVSLLDKLFTLTSNPLCFGPSVLMNAPLATTLAAFAWIVPLSAILSPGSLTVTSLVLRNASTCMVPTFAAASGNISFYRIMPHSSSIYGPNAGITKLASQVLAQGTILQSKSPCGTNCSFQHSFHGPGLRCQSASNPSYLDDIYSQVAYGLYYNATYWYDRNLTMGMLMTYRNSTKAQAGDRSGYITMLCLAYNATYNVSVNYTNGLPAFTTRLMYNAPLLYLNGTESQGYGSLWHINSAMLVRKIFDSYLNGTWQKPPTTSYSIPSTSITETILAGDTNDANYGAAASLWFINRDLLTGVPELLTNLTLSTLAFSPINTATSCSASTERLVYYYNPNLLLIPYSIAVLLCLVAFTAGVWVLWKTGIRTGEIFSQILVTTRNPLLDEISRGNSLSSADSNALKEKKLMFGELKYFGNVDSSSLNTGAGSGRTGHAAFGSAEQLLKLTSKKLS